MEEIEIFHAGHVEYEVLIVLLLFVTCTFFHLKGVQKHAFFFKTMA